MLTCTIPQFIVGDLNYRLEAVDPDRILHDIVDSATAEATFSHTCSTPAHPGYDDGLGGEQGESHWLARKYEAFFFIGDGTWKEDDGSPLSMYNELDRPWENDGTEEKKFSIHSESIAIDIHKAEAFDYGPKPIALQMAISNDSYDSAGPTCDEEDSRGNASIKEDVLVSGQEQPWRWVRAYDQLTREMRKGEVFLGFSEGVISFPPSYRWNKSMLAGDFNKVRDAERERERGNSFLMD